MISTLLYRAKASSYPRMDLPSLLSAQNCFPKFYHYDRDTQEERAAFGSLVILSNMPTLSYQTDPSLCFYGILSFPSTRIDPVWHNFPKSLFFLPTYEIRQTPQETTLYTRSSFTTPSFLSSFPTLPSAPDLQGRHDEPSYETWSHSVAQALDAITSGIVEKVVLSRRSSFAFHPTTPLWSFAHQIATNNPNTHRFAFQMQPDSLFLGASPETLFQREEAMLYTEAIAGTRKRGAYKEDDIALQEELLQSDKDQREVNHICRFFMKQLQGVSQNVFHSAPHIISTNQVHHLRYQFFAHILPTCTDAALLQALHPTPAVAGFPQNTALSFLQNTEQHGRGGYAGCIGWTSSSHAHFTVAIRSAYVQQGMLHAFSGAGIVSGSHPQTEWEELDQKISHWHVSCLQ